VSLAGLTVDPLTFGSRFVGTADIDGWRIKTYQVSPATGSSMLAAARRSTVATLPARPDRVGAFGVGFLVVHLTECRLLAQLNWWVRPDELYQHTFAAPPESPQDLAPLDTAAISGISELAIAAHEGAAWRRHVIANPAGPDIEAYLKDVC
jgi:hypothetical protein